MLIAFCNFDTVTIMLIPAKIPRKIFIIFSQSEMFNLEIYRELSLFGRVAASMIVSASQKSIFYFAFLNKKLAVGSAPWMIRKN